MEGEIITGGVRRTQQMGHWLAVGLRECPQSRGAHTGAAKNERSEEHTSELQSLMRISYAVFCLKKKKKVHEERTLDNTNVKQQSHQIEHKYMDTTRNT